MVPLRSGKKITVLSTSAGNRKNNKKSSPIDSTANLPKQTLPKQQKAKPLRRVKKPSNSKCNYVLKIRDFIIYPLKTAVPVKDVYRIKHQDIITTRIPSVLTSKKTYNRFRKLVTKKLTKPKNKKNPPRKLNLLKATNKSSTSSNQKRRKATSRNAKTGNKKQVSKFINVTTVKTLKTTLIPAKNFRSSVYNAGTMVFSADEFVFRPSIPITEANYPLDNSEKLELYAQDSTVDKVVSYGFTDPAIKNYIKFPSVSKIIEETISDKTKQILANWRQKMIDDLGEDGFFNHSEALKVRGTEFHMAVRNTVLGNHSALQNCSEVTQNSLKSLSWMLEHISNPMAVESTIAHPKLGYRGVADCIAMFRNIPVLIDWKLSDKPKRDLKDTYDAPVQITAYIGALNHDPNYKWGVNHGLVAVAYANGDPCDVFLLAPKHCQIYWRHWLMRFDKFKDSDFGKRSLLRAENWIKNNIRYERLRQNRQRNQEWPNYQNMYRRNTYSPNMYNASLHHQTVQTRLVDQMDYGERRSYVAKSDPFPSHNIAKSDPFPSHNVAKSDPFPSHNIAKSDPFPSHNVAKSDPFPSHNIAKSDPFPSHNIAKSDPFPSHNIAKSDPFPSHNVAKSDPFPSHKIAKSDPFPSHTIVGPKLTHYIPDINL